MMTYGMDVEKNWVVLWSHKTKSARVERIDQPLERNRDAALRSSPPDSLVVGFFNDERYAGWAAHYALIRWQEAMGFRCGGPCEIKDILKTIFGPLLETDNAGQDGAGNES